MLDAAAKNRMAKQIGEMSGVAKLTITAIILIRADTRVNRMIAADYGISNRHVSAIKRREVWKHV